MLLSLPKDLQKSSKKAGVNERSLLHLREIRTSVIQPRYRHFTDEAFGWVALRCSEINAARAQFACG